ncbi:MAG: 1-deoxy-D-xylulose-5-phosphate synthase [Oscillospiraceae bacterium]|nr:1-deoxy-D-xylulose-5-phosphate synthase [Oscillospiraceae bacterium]
MLETINEHEDLLRLNDEQRQQLCQEIRDFLITSISQTGGHLASNLGVVELTVAIETVYNTSEDRLVFDVGHQSYVHKLLTGRRTDFSGLRQFGGIAGFPKPSESNTDAFVAGHASSSVSIALGMARARSLTDQSYDVVAVIGDGAATGGMAYEGLNDAAVSKEPMVVILNDNAMSIDRNVGGMARHLSRLRTKEGYLGMKKKYRSILRKIPGGKVLYRFSHSAKGWLKRVLLPTTIFENMGMVHLGPVDGHDVNGLITLLRSAKEMRQPVLVHVMTHKGHGYRFAEEDPARFHGIGKFDLATGNTNKSGAVTFSEAFGETVCQLAQDNSRVCAITAAMPGGTGLLPFKQQYPKRLFDVGIAEEHAMSMAGGLAKQGMVPIVALYSTFLQRAYDMILQDITMLKLHVVLAVDRAGLVGEDGETHHGIFDVGFLRQAPGLQILCPGSTAELRDMLRWAVSEQSGPVAIRYPRGGDRDYTESAWKGICETVCCHRVGEDVTIVTYGTLLQNAMEAAQLLEAQGIQASVLRLLAVSPLDAKQIVEKMSARKRVVVVEEVCSGSGIREALAWKLQRILPECRVDGIDLGDGYVTHGDMASLYKHYKMDAQSISEFIQEVVRHEN